MPRLLGVTLSVFFAFSLSNRACAVENQALKLDRTMIREPKYVLAPKYSLIELGDRGGVKVWMVEDDKLLYVDQNANGDLTDDGPPIVPRNVRSLGTNRWDFEYQLGAITPADGSRHTNFVLRRWNYEDKEDSYGLSLSVDNRMPMYAGWFGTFWSSNRETAPVIHFGGPFTPQMLRRTEFTIGESQQRLSLCFLHPGSAPGTTASRLSIDALPAEVVPKLTIEWPTATGAAPLRTAHALNERCCYWEFYTTKFALPKGIVAGKAKITIDLAASPLPLELTRTELTLPVAAKREPTSAAK